MAVLQRDTHYHTYSDYLTWSRDFGDELINGTANVREPPSPSYSHQGIVLELGHQLVRALKGKPWRVCVAPLDVRLPKSTEGDDQIDSGGTLWARDPSRAQSTNTARGGPGGYH